MGKIVAPAELPLSTMPVATLRRFAKWWDVILMEGTKLRPMPIPIPSP